MPEEFRMSVNFFSKLVPPKTFFDVQDSHPYQEENSRLDMANTVSDGWTVPGVSAESSAVSQGNVKLRPIISAQIEHGGSVQFNSDWTFYHVSFRRERKDTYDEFINIATVGNQPKFVGITVSKVVEQWELCLALNAMPQKCQSFRYEYYELSTQMKLHPDYQDGKDLYHPLPELYTTFLDAFEVTAEVLLSPIDVRTKIMSASQIQNLYNTNKPRMDKIIGPWVSEKNRIDELKNRIPKVEATFPEQLLLAAPPLLFQQRGEAHLCNLTAMQTFLNQQFDLVGASHCRIASDCPNTQSQGDIYKCKTQTADKSKHFGLNTTMLQGAIGYADFLYTMADNEVIVREDTVLPALEFLDTETTSAKIVCLFYSPSNGDTTVLTLSIEVEGTLIKTQVLQEYYGFLSTTHREQSIYYYAIILALCVAVLTLNLSLFFESNSLCTQYGTIKQEEAVKQRLSVLQMERREAFKAEHEARREATEMQCEEEIRWRRAICFNVFQIVLVLGYCTTTFLVSRVSEKEAEELAAAVAMVPWTDPLMATTSKIDSFFQAMDLLDDNLTKKRYLFYIGFAMMLMLLAQILASTAIHPRLGVLINTLSKGLDGLSHFAILFTLVFLLFSVVSWWTFAEDHDDFKDLYAAMTTQFKLFTAFELPYAIANAFENPSQHPLLVIHAVFSCVTELFLMSNFLIAIVLDAFIEAQAEYKTCDVELSVFEDTVIILKIKLREVFEWWPSKRRIISMLTNEIATKNVAWWQLVNMGISPHKARSIFLAYYGSTHDTTDEPIITDGWQSHLRPYPASHSTQWSLACDMAIDLGLSGTPSAQVWVEVEKEFTKKLSSIVHESTDQSRSLLHESLLHESRLNHTAMESFMHESTGQSKESRERLDRIELLLHESTSQSRQRLDHIESLLVNLQNPMPNGTHPISEDMSNTGAPRRVPWQQDWLQWNPSASVELATVEPRIPPAARRVARVSNLEAREFLPSSIIAFPAQPLPVVQKMAKTEIKANSVPRFTGEISKSFEGTTGHFHGLQDMEDTNFVMPKAAVSSDLIFDDSGQNGVSATDTTKNCDNVLVSRRSRAESTQEAHTQPQRSLGTASVELSQKPDQQDSQLYPHGVVSGSLYSF